MSGTDAYPSSDGLPDVAEMVQRLFPRRRSRLLVSIDLDPVPGWGNAVEDHLAFVQRLLDDAVGHYNPRVEIQPSASDDSPAPGAA